MNDSSILTIIIGSLLINNFVLTQFLGVCSFLNSPTRVKPALSLSAAIALVMTLGTAVTYPVYKFLLVPLELEYLQIVVFVLIIAILTQIFGAVMKKASPKLYESASASPPLITINCAVLGVTIMNIAKNYSFGQSIANAVGGGLGLMLAMVIFAGIRNRLESADVPNRFKGVPISFAAAALVSLSFWGFKGLAGL